MINDQDVSLVCLPTNGSINSPRAQVSSDTLEPAVSGALTLYSAWYPGPGFTGERVATVLLHNTAMSACMRK